MLNFYLFTVFGIIALYAGLTADLFLLKMIQVNAAIAFFGVALAFGLKRAEIFMKAPDGRLSLLSYLIFWPYLVINAVILRLYRLLSRENPIDEITPGLYLGCRLWNRDQEELKRRGIDSVLDATAEWKEAASILKYHQYLNIPVLDNFPPTPDQLRTAVAWIDEQLKHGGVFVHCAIGHGRSATIVAAYLLHTQKVAGAQEAIVFIKQRRPKINLQPGQVAVLYEYLHPNREKGKLNLLGTDHS